MPNWKMPLSMMRMPNLAGLLCLVVLGALLAGCATVQKSSKAMKLEQLQYAYSAAIRWGDFEGAWQLVDPKYRDEHPLTGFDLERYQQIQVTGYRDMGAQTRLDEGMALREVQIAVINRHTQTERGTRYTERWRYDAEAKTWWLTVGLPDFWAGQ